MELMLAAVTGGQVVEALIWIVVGGLIYWILDWAIKKIGLPEPFAKIAQVVLVLVVVVILVNALFLIAGKPFIKW